MSGVVALRADARQLPLPDSSVDLIVTSPPYFSLRSYTDGGKHYTGQLGAEASPAEFVAALLEVTRECVRVLKPSGSLWLNLGDKYSSGGSGQQSTLAEWSRVNARGGGGKPARAMPGRTPPTAGFPPKTLMGIPWRYALACIDDLGLILRAEVIWSKPNGLPESVTDRVRRSHESWFHFTMQPRYFAAIAEIREPLAGEFLSSGVKNPRYGRPGGKLPSENFKPSGSGLMPGSETRWNGTNGVSLGMNPLGKLPGSVWSIATEPLRLPPELGVDHFAAFPSEWPRRLILGWSPREVCTACGEGRRPVSSTEFAPTTKHPQPGGRQVNIASGNLGVLGVPRQTTITGYACACADTSAPATPGVVLDPFGGTGTTAHVAAALGRTGISVDLSADYCRVAAHPFLRDKRAAKVRAKGATS